MDAIAEATVNSSFTSQGEALGVKNSCHDLCAVYRPVTHGVNCFLSEFQSGSDCDFITGLANSAWGFATLAERKAGCKAGMTPMVFGIVDHILVNKSNLNILNASGRAFELLGWTGWSRDRAAGLTKIPK